jgi:hypothetical protein
MIMTDTEIIKALECCAKLDFENWDICKTECPYANHCYDTEKGINAMEDFLSIINRQQEEIEGLCMELDEVVIAKDLLFDEAEALIKKARAEAIKEFAERLKERYIPSLSFDEDLREVVAVKTIDNLVKEMVGDPDD